MALVSQSIPALIGGVSQQAPSQRLVSQLESQMNCLNSLTQGMRKRPNTELDAYLATQGIDLSDAHVHQINRDQYEKYVVFVLPDGIHVFDRKTGFKYPVETPSNFEGQSPINYLSLDNHTGTIRDAYQTLTSADTTWVLNTSKAVLRKTGTIAVSDNIRRTEVTITGMPVVSNNSLVGRYQLFVNGVKAVEERQTASPVAVALELKKYLEANFPSLVIYQTHNKLYIDQQKTESPLEFTEDSYRYSVVYFHKDKKYDYAQIAYRTLSVKETNAVIDLNEKKKPEALVHIRQVDYNVTYKVSVNGTTVTHTTPEATSERARAGLSIQTIISSLASKLRSAVNGITVTTGDGYMHITHTEDFTLSASDDLNNQAIVGIKHTTQLFSDLPPKAPDGFLVKIIGDVEDEGTGYWVKFVQTGDLGQGHWEESRTDTETHKIDPTTMPHILERRQDAKYYSPSNPRGIYFKFTQAEWDERTVGDDLTAPFPSFVSEWDNENNIPTQLRYIHTMTFHKNRLVFTSDENVVLSESGNYWNFFKTTAQVVKDSDRIDLAILSQTVNPIKAVLPAQKELLLYGERQQFALRSGDIFSANTVYADPLMSYDVDLRAQPQAVGKSVFFAINRQKYNGIFEAFVEDEQHSAIEVTAHCPEYIEGRVRKIATTGSEDILLVLVENEDRSSTNRVYCYSFKNQGSEKVQSAWNVWTFKGQVLDVQILKSEATFIVDYGDKIASETMNLAEDRVRDELGVPIFLDRRRELAVGEKPLSEETTVTYKGKTFAGIPYRQEAELTELSLKEEGQVSVKSGRLQLRHIKFTYDESTAFDVVVLQDAREPRIVSYEGRQIGTRSAIIGQIPVDHGTLRVPLLGKPDGMRIIIRNDEPFDCRIQSAEWEGIYHARARRV